MKRFNWFWIGFSVLLVIAAWDVTSNGLHIFSGRSSIAEELPFDESLLLLPAVSDAWSTEGVVQGWTEFALANPAGTVVIRGHEEGEHFRIQAWPVIYTKDVERARRELAEAEFTLEVVDGVAQPRFSLSVEALGWADHFEIVWEIELPAAIGVAVSTEKGRLSIQGLTGPVRAQNQEGVTQLTRISGPVFLEVASGRTHLEHVSGPAEIQAQRDDLSLMGVTGPVVLRSTETRRIYADLYADAILNISMAKAGDLQPGNTIRAHAGLELDVNGGMFHVDWAGTGRLAITAERGLIRLNRMRLGPEGSEDASIDIHMKSGVLDILFWNVISNFRLTLTGDGIIDPGLTSQLENTGDRRYEASFGTGRNPAEIRIDAGAYIAISHGGFSSNRVEIFPAIDRDLVQK